MERGNADLFIDNSSGGGSEQRKGGTKRKDNGIKRFLCTWNHTYMYVCISKLTRYTVHGRGAKSPRGSKYRLKTRSKKFKLLLKKVSKSGPKSGSKPVRFPTVIRKVACFWTVFFKTFKSSVSNLHCSVPCVTRTYHQWRNSRKSGTDTQTRDIQFLTLVRT